MRLSFAEVNMSISPLAGKPAPPEKIVDLEKLSADYYKDPSVKVSFGTSGHRGSSTNGAFTEAHVLAITQAVVDYRRLNGHHGAFFVGHDTHALSDLALQTAISVLACSDVETFINKDQEFTPTPVVSYLIVDRNRDRLSPAIADGLIITPSHNPPQDGGIKYNSPLGGPADVNATDWIQKRANELLKSPDSIKRMPFEKAISCSNIHQEDFVTPFVEALGEVVNFDAIKKSGLKIAVDPLGGSGIHYWRPIADRWGLNLTVVNEVVDKTFSFMTLDHDGVIRMDCSSPYAMVNLIKSCEKFDLGVGNDPDFDRHGIVSGGQLMNPNHFLAVAIDYLSKNRPNWLQTWRVGKTAVSSSLIDRVAEGASHRVFETPVGFKWFVNGFHGRDLGFAGEESAGASFLRQDGQVWTTDKCGFCMTLLAAEIAAVTGKLPHEYFADLTAKYGQTHYRRIDSDLTPEGKKALDGLDEKKLVGQKAASLTVEKVLTKAPGNEAPLGGVKAILSDGSWFAVRPSGTEPKMKVYAESFGGPEQLEQMLKEAVELVSQA
jgi:phosphoglucomutase